MGLKSGEHGTFSLSPWASVHVTLSCLSTSVLSALFLNH